MKSKITSTKHILPEIKMDKRTINKQNEVNDHHDFKQLVLKNQRMSQMKKYNSHQVSCNQKRFKSINKQRESKVLLSCDTINVNSIKPIIGSQTPVVSLLSNLNHKLIQQPNIYLWSKVAKQIQAETQKKDKVWQTLFRNIDTKIGGQQCCFKIARRKSQSKYTYFIIVIKFNQKIHISFNQKQWKKIIKTYRSYRQIQECISLSVDNKIVLPLNLQSQAISEHLKLSDSTQNFRNIQFP